MSLLEYALTLRLQRFIRSPKGVYIPLEIKIIPASAALKI